MRCITLAMVALLAAGPSFADPATDTPQSYNGPITSTKTDDPAPHPSGTIVNTGTGSCTTNADGTETCH